MGNGGRLGARNVPGVDGYSGVWSLREIADARRAGWWTFLPVVAGLLRWYEADALALSDGAAVSSWTDRSAAADHAVQATGSRQPTYRKAIVNGHAVLRFDGSDFMQFAKILDSSGATAHFFVVAKSDATGSRGLLGIRPSSAATGWYLRYDAATTLRYGHTGITPSALHTITDQFNVIEVQRAGLTVMLGANGSLEDPTVTGGYSASSANRTVIGVEEDGAEGFLYGDIAEIVIYDRVLGAGERNELLTYLQDKYAIT